MLVYVFRLRDVFFFFSKCKTEIYCLAHLGFNSYHYVFTSKGEKVEILL